MLSSLKQMFAILWVGSEPNISIHKAKMKKLSQTQLSYKQYKEGRLTLLVTFCVGTAFLP